MRLVKPTVSLLLVTVFVLMASSLGFAYQRDVLRIGIPSLPNELDGQVTMGNEGQRVMFNIFEKLVHFDKEDPSIVTPQLAESWVWLDDNTLEFTLRQGVLFHNGQPMTAHDIKYGMDRAMNPATGSGSFFAMLATIDSIDVIDDYTLRITTADPDPILLTRLASLWGSFAIPNGYIEEVGEEAYITKPVSTGPYMVESFEPDRIVLRAFEDYWGVKPNVQELVYIEIPELAARMTALINGEVDLISTIGPDQVGFLEGYDHIYVLSKPIANMHILTFNITQPPTDNKLLRQALALALIARPSLMRCSLAAQKFQDPTSLGNMEAWSTKTFPKTFMIQRGQNNWWPNPGTREKSSTMTGSPTTILAPMKPRKSSSRCGDRLELTLRFDSVRRHGRTQTLMSIPGQIPCVSQTSPHKPCNGGSELPGRMVRKLPKPGPILNYADNTMNCR